MLGPPSCGSSSTSSFSSSEPYCNETGPPPQPCQSPPTHGTHQHTAPTAHDCTSTGGQHQRDVGCQGLGQGWGQPWGQQQGWRDPKDWGRDGDSSRDGETLKMGTGMERPQGCEQGWGQPLEQEQKTLQGQKQGMGTGTGMERPQGVEDPRGCEQ